ncbi:hypothetical protein BT96DRAFT_933307 [Gymnopus androsaceus JB14]|uniref:Uncharacterized protein n=1 Tax=Gymnopus androsaceus JB14 TaxID=1447944 RepID=A0A6A4IE41_9AGAR|nr:hypothetical protein BT96DRAFT_933307 [Gymnopus androsaceus JB14]
MESNLLSLWIVELANVWNYATIPKRSNIVISFRISTVFIAALNDVAFFIINRTRELFRNGPSEVAITALSFSVDLTNVVGFIAFANVGREWIPSMASNTVYRATPGCQDSFFTTTPLYHGYLSSPHAVAETLCKARLTPTCVWRRANGDDHWRKRMLDLTSDLDTNTSDGSPIGLDSLISFTFPTRNDLFLSNTIDSTHVHGPDHATPSTGTLLEIMSLYGHDNQSRVNLRLRERFENEQFRARVMRARATVGRIRANADMFVDYGILNGL